MEGLIIVWKLHIDLKVIKSCKMQLEASKEMVKNFES